jgi:hypothetical protein
VTATWAAVLGGLERELDGVEAALACGRHDVVVGDLDVPDDLGPLPDAWRPRAAAVQARMAGAELELARAAQSVRQAMVLSGTSAPAPSFHDARH